MTDDDLSAHRADIPTRILLGSFSADRPDPLHDQLRAARAGDADAVSVILDRVRSAATGPWPGLEGAIVVAVPAHLPGPANPLVLAVADALAAVQGWDHRRGGLRRVNPSPEGKTGGTRDAATEATTLAWETAPGGTAIVLVDDVIRSGTTLTACSIAIRATGDPRDVVAVVVAGVAWDLGHATPSGSLRQ